MYLRNFVSGWGGSSISSTKSPLGYTTNSTWDEELNWLKIPIHGHFWAVVGILTSKVDQTDLVVGWSQFVRCSVLASLQVSASSGYDSCYGKHPDTYTRTAQWPAHTTSSHTICRMMSPMIINKSTQLLTYVSQTAGIHTIVKQRNAKVCLTHFWEVDRRKHRHLKRQVVKHRRKICIYDDVIQRPVQQWRNITPRYQRYHVVLFAMWEACGGYIIFVCNHPPRPTQPGRPSMGRWLPLKNKRRFSLPFSFLFRFLLALF